MNYELYGTLLVTALAIILFVFNILTVDLSVLLCVVLLGVFKLVGLDDILSGLSNPATVTILCMFIITEAVSRTGVLTDVGKKIQYYSKNKEYLGVALLSTLAGITSMFINNTATVALLIPVCIRLSQQTGWALSYLLMPISFGAMVGGVCTLIGTSTNLLGNSILIDHNETGFAVFSFFSKGIVFFMIGIAYITLFYKRLIPIRRKGQGNFEAYEMQSFKTYLEVRENSKFVGESIQKINKNDFKIINKYNTQKNSIEKIKVGDILEVILDLEILKNLFASKEVNIMPSVNSDYFKKRSQSSTSEETMIIEAVVTPTSQLVNTKISGDTLFRRYGVKLLALRHHGKVLRNKINESVIESGDSFLIALPKNSLGDLRDSKLFLLLNEPYKSILNRNKKILVASILFMVILLSSFSVFPLHFSALIGVVLLALFNILPLKNAYRAVDWRIIFVLTGLFTLGRVIEKNGVTDLIANGLISNIESFGPKAIVGTYFLITVALTSFISNNAAVMFISPLAIETAQHTTQITTENLVLLIMFASSLCFMTPVGYQTNLMIYGVGNYRFLDFLKFGLPLTLLLFVASIFLFT